MNRADEWGIMEVYPNIEGSIVTDDETLDDLVEKAGKSESAAVTQESSDADTRPLKSSKR